MGTPAGRPGRREGHGLLARLDGEYSQRPSPPGTAARHHQWMATTLGNMSRDPVLRASTAHVAPTPAKTTLNVGRWTTRVWTHRLPKGPPPPNEVLRTRPAAGPGERRKRGPLLSATLRRADARLDDCRPGGGQHACSARTRTSLCRDGHKRPFGNCACARAPLKSGVAGEGEARHWPAPPAAASRPAARALGARQNEYLPGAANEPTKHAYDLCAALYTGRVGPWG